MTQPPGQQSDLFSHVDPGRNEALIRSDPTRYADAVRNISDYGILLIDRDGKVRSWNRGAENLTGFREDEVAASAWSLLFSREAVFEGLPEKTLQFVRSNRHTREEHKRLRKGGESFTALTTVDAIRADNGELLGFVEVFTDITEQKEREQTLYRRATRDPMTGVFSRGHFTEMAAQEIERARRFAEPLSLILLDIDHFKNVNDTYGHDVGDQTIIALARVCGEFIRKIDFISRIGGEEFVITLPRANKEPAMEMANRLRVKLSEQRIKAPAKEFGFTVSMGVASLRPHTKDLAELLRNADTALYKAKREGRNRVEAWFE